MKETIRKIIRKVLEKLSDSGIKYSDNAEDLIFETGNAETGYRHLEQMGGGPAVGFFQIEGWVIKDCWDNYIVFRKPLIEFAKSLGFNEEDMEFSVTSNIALQVFFARICYRRKPGSIPETMEDRASYWKKHYNTPLGKGTPEHYLKANK
tara:strand:+ start:700 stop:1149 length:450 start_codon:yes stop_codon:yes gene_type:complete